MDNNYLNCICYDSLTTRERVLPVILFIQQYLMEDLQLKATTVYMR